MIIMCPKIEQQKKNMHINALTCFSMITQSPSTKFKEKAIPTGVKVTSHLTSPILLDLRETLIFFCSDF